MAHRASICVLVATLASLAHADELWRQNPIDAVGGYSSQDARNPGGIGWFSEVADNFTAPSAWSIAQVEFWGGYVTTVPGHTNGFTVRIYADNNGAIGSLVHTEDNLTFTENPYYTSPAPDNWVGYHYVVNFPAPYALPAPGAYWISIVAILDRGGTSTEPQWGWVQAPFIANPPSANQWFFSPGNFHPLNADMAFVLNGSPTSGGGGGVCCRGSTCTTSITSAAACAATLTPGHSAGASFIPAGSCNAGTSSTTPCCYADYNKQNRITVQDIFDYLNDWFAGDPLTRFATNGAPATLTVQSIFDFLNAWFAGGC